MAKARKVTRKRKARTRRSKASSRALAQKVKDLVAELKKKETFKVAKIGGSVKNGKLELETDYDVEIKFISLNAPFKTKALVSAP